jgi:hypothetical protein
MQKTAITGACLHGKAGYQQSQWRWRYLAPYLIGRTRRDHERAQWHRGQPGLERKERGEYQQTAWQRPTRPIAGQHRSARAARRWHSAAYPVILTLSFRVVVQPSAHKIASLGKRSGRRAPVDDQARPAACVHASWLSVCQRFLLLAQGADVISLPEQSACPQAKKSRRAARRIQH